MLIRYDNTASHNYEQNSEVFSSWNKKPLEEFLTHNAFNCNLYDKHL